jgi:hypothetical protein
VNTIKEIAARARTILHFVRHRRWRDGYTLTRDGLMTARIDEGIKVPVEGHWHGGPRVDLISRR